VQGIVNSRVVLRSNLDPVAIARTVAKARARATTTTTTENTLPLRHSFHARLLLTDTPPTASARKQVLTSAPGDEPLTGSDLLGRQLSPEESKKARANANANAHAHALRFALLCVRVPTSRR
jgi:hypothetical protein